jgi:hypothetical protein
LSRSCFHAEVVEDHADNKETGDHDDKKDTKDSTDKGNYISKQIKKKLYKVIVCLNRYR